MSKQDYSAPIKRAGLWLLRVRPGARSLLPDIERLRSAARGTPGQLVLLLPVGVKRSQFHSELPSLRDCIVVPEDRALAAISQGELAQTPVAPNDFDFNPSDSDATNGATMSQKSRRTHLMIRLTDLLRDIPHRPGCPRQPPLLGHVACTCDVGDALLAPLNSLSGIIRDVTEPGSTDAD